MLRFPERIPPVSSKARSRRCQGHLSWVRRHRCCVSGCLCLPIEAAHVRKGTDGGTRLKPSDRWVVSLCALHHREQHSTGEQQFEHKYDFDLKTLANEFARRSPYWPRLMLMT